MKKDTIELIKHIETSNNVEKLETTISMLMFGWVMDDSNKEEYEHLIGITQHRLRVLMIIKGDQHPLCNLDLKKDKKKIEMSVMMSIIKQVSESEDIDRKIDLFNSLSMN
jgi:hypothetical protein